MRKIKLRLIALFLIQLIILLPLAFADIVNSTATTAGNITIGINIPNYVNSPLIDIPGISDPQTALNLYVNGVKQRRTDSDSSGNFSFNSVELSVFKSPNILKIEAVKNGVTSESSFNVFVDANVPQITLQPVPGRVTTPEIYLNGTVSENVTINITVNDNPVFTLIGNSFSKAVALSEGENNITITATDKANNIAVKEGKVLLGVKPPEIKNLAPKSGSFFYEGTAITDIEGDTTPYAKVSLYISKEIPEGEPEQNIILTDSPDYKTTADAKGHFKFDKINLEGGVGVSGRAGSIIISGRTGPNITGSALPTSPANAQEAAEVITAKPEETHLPFYIVVKDDFGFKSQEKFSYTIGTCYSGHMDWSVQNLAEYQSPNLFSPERLADGTEIATFILNLSYQGFEKNPKIKDVKIERACKATALTDDRIKYGCKVLPSSIIKKGNDKLTTWYVRINLQKLQGMENFTNDLWKDLSHSFVLPLKIRLDYSYESENKTTTNDYQTSCLNLGYQVDTSRIDPRDVLPDWLLTDGMDYMNRTIDTLNKIIPDIEKVMKYVAVACLVGFGLKLITTIYRRWQSWMNYLQDKALVDKKPEEKCPKPGEKYNKDDVREDQKTQADLDNAELTSRCPMASAAWETEKKAYQAYRWTCDRFLCHGTPARWTGDALPVAGRAVTSEEDTTVWDRIRGGLQCTEQTGTNGIVLRENRACTIKANKECWDYNGKTYAYTGETKARGQETLYVLKPVDPTTGVVGIGSELQVLKQGNSVMLEKPDDKPCAQICKDHKFKEAGRCVDPQEFGPQASKDDRENRIFNTEDCFKERKVCYCSSKRDTTIPADTEGKWDYRYDKIARVSYSIYTYYADRDVSACFGQNNWIFPSSPYLSPQDTIPAFQCLCISQIRARLVLLRNILMGMYNCLKQIQKTGKADAGVCKEIFTQYVCKWISQLIAYFAKGCIPWKGTGNDVGIGDFMQAGASSIFGGVEESTNDLLNDYNNVPLRDYLGLGEGTVTEKICLFALTGDWGLNFEGLMDAAYSAPFHTSASAWPATREYLTWNPDNQQADYDYRTAWMIAPGCKIDTYTVSLACVTDFEINNYNGATCPKEKIGAGDDTSPAGCDCSAMYANSRIDQTKPGPSVILYRGLNLGQGVFEDKSKNSVQEAPYRYDHIKIQVNVNDPELAKNCLPQEAKIGPRSAVFYSPISDLTTKDILACRFDQISGSFVCDQGQLLWDLRGRASLGKIEYDNETYMGDQLKITKLPITVQGKKQCLYISLKNERGELVTEKVEEYSPLGNDSSSTRVIDETDKVIIDRISPENFGKYSDTVSVSSETASADYGSNFVRVPKQDGTNIVSGTYNVYFKNDGLGDVEYGNFIKIGDNSSWEPLISSTTYSLSPGGMAFTFRNPVVPKTSKCAGEGTAQCKKYIFQISKGRPVLADKQQTWSLHLEMRHAPGESNEGSCDDSTNKDIITIQGKNVEQTLPIIAYPWTRSEKKVCQYRDGLKSNNQECDCNSDSKVDGTEDCTGDTNGDGVIKKEDNERAYCYQKDSKYSCHALPKCNAGTYRNTKDCDCNMNDEVDDNCKDKYCWTTGSNAGNCLDNAQEIKTTPQITKVEISYPVKSGGTITKEVSTALQGIDVSLDDIAPQQGITFKITTANTESIYIAYDTSITLAVSKQGDVFTTTQLFSPNKRDYGFQVRATRKDTSDTAVVNFALKAS